MKLNWEKLIVALDLEDKEKIQEVVSSFSATKTKFKIGSIAFTKLGPNFLKELIDQGKDIFLDLKLNDIPNTMAKAATVITGLGVWAFTVHLSSGKEALVAVRLAVDQEAKKMGKTAPLILGVSVLTSSSLEMDKRQESVKGLCELAAEAGLDGVIASSLDAKMIRQQHGDKLQIVTPGIRGSADNLGDQKRVTTANQAFDNGADYIVVGRPIIENKDYLTSAKNILES